MIGGCRGGKGLPGRFWKRCDDGFQIDPDMIGHRSGLPDDNTHRIEDEA
jgi:hypothetical protein